MSNPRARGERKKNGTALCSSVVMRVCALKKSFRHPLRSLARSPRLERAFRLSVYTSRSPSCLSLTFRVIPPSSISRSCRFRVRVHRRNERTNERTTSDMASVAANSLYRNRFTAIFIFLRLYMVSVTKKTRASRIKSLSR